MRRFSVSTESEREHMLGIDFEFLTIKQMQDEGIPQSLATYS